MSLKLYVFISLIIQNLKLAVNIINDKKHMNFFTCISDINSSYNGDITTQ